MAKVKRKKRNPVRSKQKILLTAERLFAERGISVSVDMIAHKAGLNKRMIYHYFGSKDKLWRAVIERQYQKVSAIEAEISSSQNLSEIIQFLIERYYQFLANDKYFVKLLVYENLRAGRSVRKLSVSQSKIPIIKALGQALKKSDIADLDPRNLLIDCLALCFFYFSNQATLSALFDTNLSDNENIKNRIEHIKKVFFKLIGQ